MWNTPTPDQLAKIPRLYDTENTPVQDKMIHLHFFFGGSDWYIAEFEWGYISFAELQEIRLSGFEIDNDLYWEPCRAAEVATIRKAQGWGCQ